MTRRSMYGLAMAPSDEAYAAWVVEERERAKLAMRRHRAKRKAELAGEPDYPVSLRDALLRWIDARRSAMAESDLAAVVHYARRAVRSEGIPEYDLIQDRGMGKLLRALGFTLKRHAQGMVVFGLRV